MRLFQLIIVSAAVLALVVGSSALPPNGYPYFAIVVIASSAFSIWWAYREVARRWILESYQLLLECRLAKVKARLEKERSAPTSAIKRPLLDLLWGEVLFWSGQHQEAYEAARRLDPQQLPELWRGSVYELVLTAAAFTGRVAEARAVLTEHAAVLRERPGYHQLEALIALREGDAAKARERWNSASDSEPRPPLVRAALAMLAAEIAVAHGESPDAFVAEALAFSGESFVAEQTRASIAPRRGTANGP